MRFGVGYIGALFLVGCSSAASFDDPYGPRGQGFVGSAYGYSETTVSPGNYIVNYTDLPEANARRGLKRRAAELCGSETPNLGPISVESSGFPTPIPTATASLSCANLPPAPTPGKAPAGSVGNQTLRSCSPADIEAQIAAITARGRKLSMGAGMKQISRVQAETLGASISIYKQAMNRCNVDRAAYQNAIDQLERSRQVALSNVGAM